MIWLFVISMSIYFMKRRVSLYDNKAVCKQVSQLCSERTHLGKSTKVAVPSNPYQNLALVTTMKRKVIHWLCSLRVVSEYIQSSRCSEHYHSRLETLKREAEVSTSVATVFFKAGYPSVDARMELLWTGSPSSQSV